MDGPSVKIVKKGILTAEREKTFPIRNITTVDVKESSIFVEGFIRLSTGDVLPTKNALYKTGGYKNPREDENAVTFRDKESYNLALNIKKYIEEYSEEHSSTATVSAADEIIKLKALMDDGIITLEEFNAKKKQLLGI
ncbi:MAG: SHOCT domain-containing protein [Desulfomonilaceae bacterium]